jgi:SNF family Na+-dependent transporter
MHGSNTHHWLILFPFLPGAFLIPYLISVLTCGIPFFLMEVSLGQYFGLTNVQVLEKVAPIFKGKSQLVEAHFPKVGISIFYEQFYLKRL